MTSKTLTPKAMHFPPSKCTSQAIISAQEVFKRQRLHASGIEASKICTHTSGPDISNTEQFSRQISPLIPGPSQDTPAFIVSSPATVFQESC